MICVPEGTPKSVNEKIEPIIKCLTANNRPFEVWYEKEVPGYRDRGITTDADTQTFVKLFRDLTHHHIADVIGSPFPLTKENSS